MLTVAEYKARFNRKAILTPAEKMRQTIFREFGAYTRVIARNSMTDVNPTNPRAQKKISLVGFILSGGRETSKPGSASFSRLGFVKQFIFFAVGKDSVVIGPAKLQGVKSPDNALDVLEHGGTEQLFVGKKVRISVTAQYKARPTMGLAFAKAIDKKLPRLIEGGIMREVA